MRACPKPEPLARKKAKAQRVKAQARKACIDRVWARAQGKCEACGGLVVKPVSGWEFMWGQVHHIKPRSLGGRDTLSNLILLDPVCHARAHRLAIGCPKPASPPRQRHQEPF
jgi:5-methylcytosine-specific restriction endonuclease McrA